MEYFRQTIGSAELNSIFNLPPSLRNRKVEVIIIPAENSDIEKTPRQKRPLGFAKGADVPDSFFEPLSEEELQTWGL